MQPSLNVILSETEVEYTFSKNFKHKKKEDSIYYWIIEMFLAVSHLGKYFLIPLKFAVSAQFILTI